MDKHIPTNNKITGDKPNQQLFPKQVATQPSLLNQTNRTHRSIEIKTFKSEQQMKPQRKYRLGTTSNNYWGGLNWFYWAPTFTLIFRNGINLNNKKTIHKIFNIYFYLFSIFTTKCNRKQSGQLLSLPPPTLLRILCKVMEHICLECCQTP